MGFLIFIIVVITIFIFIFIILGALGLVFGGRDPYEEELRRMDYEDEVLDRLDRYNRY